MKMKNGFVCLDGDCSGWSKDNNSPAETSGTVLMGNETFSGTFKVNENEEWDVTIGALVYYNGAGQIRIFYGEYMEYDPESEYGLIPLEGEYFETTEYGAVKLGNVEGGEYLSDGNSPEEEYWLSSELPIKNLDLIH
jgi:hypothetical protein